MKGADKRMILVTGGGGYIGSHAVKALKASGYEIIVLDNLVYGHRDFVEQVLKVELIEGDMSDRMLLRQLFLTYQIDAVVHFAAYAYVEESVRDPSKYYANNFGGTLALLNAMREAAVTKLVFSSTCATYGIPDSLPITEGHPQRPINPYGKSKLMVEQLLSDFGDAYGLTSVCFRYFNAAGADPFGQLGEDHAPETHLIPLVLDAAAGRRESISIFGTDYPTPDGTCLRDYIHVSDLARAHVLGLEYLLAGGGSQVFNLSNGNGFSVRQVIETAKAVTQRSIRVVEQDRREGDPPALVGASGKALEVLEWRPEYPELTDIITHAWRWYQHRHGLAVEEKGLDPLVSIVVPAYNASAFIASTLKAAIAQTYQNLEILVVDDGSGDRTVEIVQAFAEKDARIKLFQQPNAGVAAARNLGIEKASGAFIAPIDADDLWLPDAVEKMVLQFQQAPADTGVIYAWSVDIDAQNRTTGGFHAATVTGDVYKTLICHNFLGNASSTMIRRDCFEKVGGYSRRLKLCNAQGCEDWDLYLRLAERFKFGVVAEFLVGYRKLPLSMSQDFDQMARSQDLMLKTLRKKRSDIPGYLYRISRSSFYLFIAQQCDKANRPQATVWWLWQALKNDPVTPLARLGWHLLLLKNGMKQLLIRLFGQPDLGPQELAARTRDAVALDVAAADLVMTDATVVERVKIHRFKIWLKVLVGNVLHRTL